MKKVSSFFNTQFWWQKPSCICYCLTPFALGYRTIIALRRWCYQFGLKKSQHFPIPVIVVGNITVGGTGKTPLVIWLCDFLRQRGLRPGVVSRGYGGSQNHHPCWVTSTSNPAQVGDEAVLIAQKTTCPMVIGKRRAQAVETLLANTDCNVILSDDGLQHYALARDLELIVIDGVRRFGNGACLPAGPLREPLSRLKTADFLITNGLPKLGEYSFNLNSGAIYNILDPKQIWDTARTTQCIIHAVAGIGHPERFFITLRQLGFSIIEHVFPDHYVYRAEDLQFPDNYPIIMTEKDAVKCRNFADERYWCLPVHAQPDPDFITAFSDTLTLLRGR
ncbi:MAG: tetraacyldisaccharide 4'-kinase [Gammaproteobacteria bacterium]